MSYKPVMDNLDPKRGILVRVEAPHFVAGMILVEGVCREAAPILRWMRGKPWPVLLNAINRYRWTYQELG